MGRTTGVSFLPGAVIGLSAQKHGQHWVLSLDAVLPPVLLSITAAMSWSTNLCLPKGRETEKGDCSSGFSHNARRLSPHPNN